MSYKQVIIIPGIMGSELQCNEYKIWPPNIAVWWKGINVLAKKLEDTNSDEIESVSIYKKYYGKLVEFAETIADEVTVFHYDWRQDNFKHIYRLKQLINKEADEVILIAHSMGGIVAKLFLNSDPNSEVVKKVSKLISIGTPWKGAAEAYLYLQFGFGPSFIKGAFKSVIPCFESVYQLLPNKEYVEENEVNFGYGYLNNKGWNGVCDDYYIPLLKKHGLEYNDVLLKFYNQMSLSLPEWVEHHEIVGYNMTTLTSINDDGLKIKGKYGNGDGTVPLHSAVTNTSHKYFIQGKHSLLPNNKEIHNIIKDIIVANKCTEDIVSDYHLLSYEKILDERFDFKVVRVACPVNVSLLDDEGKVLYGDMSEMKADNLLDIFIKGEESVKYIDNDVYFILEKRDEANKLHVEAYEEGAVSISIDEYENGVLDKVAKFKTFNMDNSKSAEITINRNIEKCKVEVKDEYNKEIEKVIVKDKNNEEKVKLPETKYSFIGDNIKELENGDYIATGDIYLNILDVVCGTADVMDTFYSINESNNMVVNGEDKILLNLESGKNTIKVYSVDIFNNVEHMSERNIFYIEKVEDRIPKVKIKATPDSYCFNFEFEEDKEFEKLSLPLPTVTLKFDKNDGVISNFNMVENKGIIRKISLEVIDILGTIISKSITLDEKLLKLIMESTATVKEYETFMEKIGIANIKSYKSSINGKTHIYRTLSNSKLADSDLLEFKNEKIEIMIDKMKEYEIMFSTLREYVDLNENKDYTFEFSVFSSNKKYSITDISLNVSLAVESNSSVNQYNEIKSVSYEIVDDRYIFKVNTNDINKWLLDSEEVFDKVDNLYILIKLDDETNKILRAFELNIK
ncbi:hypothetical protein [uncultured Clostridium sp.]|uniref:lipase/acyltransferase domain-containing protein n=1 Tax=uncultured Clostridium sp. TaxID=59620 RepID=UPI0025E285A5|nr:hypothetical protein [uncultured Clostridium sp.]